MTKKLIGGLIAIGLVVGLSVYVYLLTNNKITIGYNEGYEPDQPIPFSHKLHAGQYKVDCQFCHTGAATTRHATVPSLDICMKCHMVVANTSPHIQKLMKAYNSGEPIQWNKVTLLPDHVKFNHSAHIKAGKQCQECHGPVETMSVVYQYSGLQMGWCVNCHRKPENNASTDCGTCHY